jgi:hypothetical protein
MFKFRLTSEVTTPIVPIGLIIDEHVSAVDLVEMLMRLTAISTTIPLVQVSEGSVLDVRIVLGVSFDVADDLVNVCEVHWCLLEGKVSSKSLEGYLMSRVNWEHLMSHMVI